MGAIRRESQQEELDVGDIRRESQQEELDVGAIRRESQQEEQKKEKASLEKYHT